MESLLSGILEPMATIIWLARCQPTSRRLAQREKHRDAATIQRNQNEKSVDHRTPFRPLKVYNRKDKYKPEGSFLAWHSIIFTFLEHHRRTTAYESLAWRLGGLCTSATADMATRILIIRVARTGASASRLV